MAQRRASLPKGNALSPSRLSARRLDRSGGRSQIFYHSLFPVYRRIFVDLPSYLGAWNAIPPARPNPLLTYICKIVRNISLKIYYRKEAAKRNSTYTIAMEEIEACIADPNTVEAEIEARELARIIESFLDTLTVENRVIFMRRYWFSDSCKDIAEFVGLSEKNISVRLTRIRQKMKNYLAEREVFV